jgi:murein DD-endopeptidase MepM/ murein hydrolase activator NlpD
MDGGTGIDKTQREAYVNIAKQFVIEAQKRADEAVKPYEYDIQGWNDTVGYNAVSFDATMPTFIMEGQNPSTFYDSMSDFDDGSDNSEVVSFYRDQRITQGFNTPAKSRANGGYYAQSTVDAWGGKHSGLDIAVPNNTPIPAPDHMEILSVSGSSTSKSGWGLTVVAKDTAGRTHRWSHLNKADIAPGQTISKGQVIALSGNSGNSTGPHIDYRIRENGSYIDPLTLFT